MTFVEMCKSIINEGNESSKDILKEIELIYQSPLYRKTAEEYEMISYNTTAEEYLKSTGNLCTQDEIDAYNAAKLEHMKEWMNGPTEFEDIEYNEWAKSFDEVNLIIDYEWKVKDFDSWLKKHFPKEYDILETLSNKEFFGIGFENYVCERLTCGGIYGEYEHPIIEFRYAKPLFKKKIRTIFNK